MKPLRFGCLFVIFINTMLLAQQKTIVPPPAKPEDDGSSLEVTMKFIQDMLNDVGSLNFVGYCHDNAVGTDWTIRDKVEFTNIVASPSSCQVSYHWYMARNGN